VLAARHAYGTSSAHPGAIRRFQTGSLQLCAVPGFVASLWPGTDNQNLQGFVVISPMACTETRSPRNIEVSCRESIQGTRIGDAPDSREAVQDRLSGRSEPSPECSGSTSLIQARKPPRSAEFRRRTATSSVDSI